MGRRVVSALCALVLAAALVPAGAPADGDPASDVLLAQNVFYPYRPPVPLALQHRLTALTDRAKAARFPIKVALIGAPADLGAITSLFAKPRAYAQFLDKELSYTGPQPLLVVMPNGYGVAGLSGAAVTAMRSLPAPTGPAPTRLASAAIAAIPKLADAEGHPLRGGPTSAGGGGGGEPGVLLLVLILAAIIVASTLLVLRVRQPTSGARR